MKPAPKRPVNIAELAWRTMPEPQKRMAEQASRRQESEVPEEDAEGTAGGGSGGGSEEEKKEKFDAALARPEMRRLQVSKWGCRKAAAGGGPGGARPLPAGRLRVR